MNQLRYHANFKAMCRKTKNRLEPNVRNCQFYVIHMVIVIHIRKTSHSDHNHERYIRSNGYIGIDFEFHNPDKTTLGIHPAADAHKRGRLTTNRFTGHGLFFSRRAHGGRRKRHIIVLFVCSSHRPFQIQSRNVTKRISRLTCRRARFLRSMTHVRRNLLHRPLLVAPILHKHRIHVLSQGHDRKHLTAPARSHATGCNQYCSPVAQYSLAGGE